MKRLDEIPKKSLFEVPEGYFDRLPMAIQVRVASPSPAIAWGKLAVRYALPVVILAGAAVFFLSDRNPVSAEEVIAGIDSEQLVAYLEEGEVNLDDLLDYVPLDAEEVQALEEDALGEYALDEPDIEVLANEFDTLRN